MEEKLKKIIIVLICLFFLMPMFAFHGPFPPPKVCTMHFVHYPYHFPKISIKNFLDNSFQKQFQAKNNPYFFWNRIYFKTFNTFMYYVFKRSYVFEHEIVIGKDGDLSESYYARSIYRNYGNDDENSSLASKYCDDLAFVDKYLKSKNIKMILLIEPCKTVFSKNTVPLRFKLNCNDAHSYFDFYNLYMSKLNENGIKFIDVPNLLSHDKSSHIFFTKGSVHWADYPAYLALSKIVDYINQEKKILEPPKINKIVIDNKPDKIDGELTDSLQLFELPYNYPVEHFILDSSKNPSDLKVAFVGSCFFEKVFTLVDKSHMFKKYSYYKYFDVSRKDFFDDGSFKKEVFDKDVSPQDLIGELLKKDVIVLSINQIFINRDKDDYILKFVKAIKKYAETECKLSN